jgi:hypothetical protein
MTFTVVRAVREAESIAPEPTQRPRRLVEVAAPSIVAAAMDIPYVEEVLRLDLNDFAETIPGALK